MTSGRVASYAATWKPTRLGAFAYVVSGDVVPDSIDLLVDDGFMLAYVSPAACSTSSPSALISSWFRTLKPSTICFGSAPGCDDEVVLELALVAV